MRSFYEPFNTGDTSVYDTILAEDWADHPLGMGQQPGRAGFPPVIEMFRAIFPDLHITNDDVIVCGDKATVRSTINATHSGGDLFGIPPTGKPLQFMAIDIHRLENGQIVETWHIEDFSAFSSSSAPSFSQGRRRRRRPPPQLARQPRSPSRLR